MCERKILRKQTQFIVLPNELIYCIFEYLIPVDIFRAFAQLNHHYADLVRFYIKRIDLTDDWQWDRQELQWICGTIETLKVDQFHVDLLHDSSKWEDPTSCPIELNSSPPGKKVSLRSVMKKILSPFHKYTTTPQSSFHDDTSVVNSHFPRLRSVHLVNIPYWSNVVFNMNLNSLNVSFDDSTRYCYPPTLIPQTVTQFSTNTVMNINIFHTNLIDLNVCVYSIVSLIELVKQTPNIQHLHVTFADGFHDRLCVERYQFTRFETMITNFRRLCNLTHLSFSTKYNKDSGNNERLPFDQIQLFIDRCCPNKTILKKVALKLHYIMFDENMWSTIVRYKNTFDRFNFYASFIAEHKDSVNMLMSLASDQFDFYMEDCNPSRPQARCIHIYSLPFDFDRLHGFISCSNLSSCSSFSSVRHLYFAETGLECLISFESLAKRMPYLVSITCNFCFIQRDNITVSARISDRDMFNHVRFLHLISHCWHKDCLCDTLLPQLLDRMPYLQSLTTSVIDFVYGKYPLPPIKRLDLRQCHFASFGTLAERLPYLSAILLDDVPTCPRQLSRLVTAVFRGIPSIKLVSFSGVSITRNDQTQYEQIAKKALTQVQKVDKRLRHLKLDYEFGLLAFYLQNL